MQQETKKLWYKVLLLLVKIVITGEIIINCIYEA